MPDKQVRVDLQAVDHASEKVRDVADEVKDLEKLDPEVEISADTKKAERQVEELSDDLKDLKRRDTEIVLTGKIGNLKAQLSEAESALKQVQGKAEDTRKAVDDIGGSQGPRLAGNTVADLTGPLGEASGVAGDLGGVMDGMADIAEAAMTRMGGAAAAMAPQMATALGGVGLAVAAIGAAFSYFSGQAAKAKAEQKKLLDGQEALNDAIKEGDSLRFAEQLREDYGKAYDEAKKLGVPIEEVTKFLTGQIDTLPSLEAAWIDASNTVATESEYMANGARNANYDAAASFLRHHDAIVAQKDAYNEAHGTWVQSESDLSKIASATGITADKTTDLKTAQDKAKTSTDNLRDALDKMKGSLSFERAVHNFNQTFDAAMAEAQTSTGVTYDSILDMKDAIFEVAEFAGLTPIEVQSLLEEVEQGDLASVKEKVNSYYRQNPAGIDTTVNEPTMADVQGAIQRLRQRLNAAWAASGGRGSAPIFGPSMVPAAPAGPTVNVTQNVPRGYKGDVLADAQAAAKRSGGLYQRNGR